jgi:hypothetical protein
MKKRTEKENPQHKRSRPIETTMNSFEAYLLQRTYQKIAKLGDKLAKADQHIDWEAFRPIISGIYTNDTEK